jgi:hypothetical protein
MEDDLHESTADDTQTEMAPHIHVALLGLPLFDGLYLRMQATNVSIVDRMIEPMESDLLHELIERERTPIPAVMAVSAMSQMWMFAVYELLRTWRQRVQSLLRTYETIRGLARDQQMAALEIEANSVQSAREDANLALDMQRESVLRLGEDGFAENLRVAYSLIEPIFRRIESLRVTLAKHEVPKSRGLVAFAPGYGRIDSFTGSIYWQIDLKDNTVDVINRRSIADDLKGLRLDTPDRNA